MHQDNSLQIHEKRPLFKANAAKDESPKEAKNSGPEDLALICPRRGLLNVSCKYNRFLEYWLFIMAEPIVSDHAQRTWVSMFN
jgi:hypothetical protein